MANDIKNLLDSIINNTNNSYPSRGEYVGGTDSTPNPVTFDKGQFREKISMFVLKDIICAMMHDETKDLDHMIDDSIMKHIRDNYDGSYYGYLTRSRDDLKSPLLSDIIQEIDDKTEEVADAVSRKKDISVADKIDVNAIVKDVENYDEFRNRIKEQVSKQVVDDVTKIVTTGNDAPVFDNLDDKLKKSDESDPTNESVILRMCGTIVTESAMTGSQISTEEGINKAIVEYCLYEMDYMFKQRPKTALYAKYGF